MAEQLQRCSRCKSTKLLETYFSKNVKGLYMKTCDNCRNRHKCVKCDYKCSSSTHLNRHIKMVHDKIKDHACTKCDSKFSSSSDLKVHIHDKIKDFECPTCDYTCSCSSNLKHTSKSAQVRSTFHQVS